MNFKDISQSILEHVGGKDNIVNVLHCSTRLRIELKDYLKADIDSVKSITGVISAVNSGGQFQVIIGNNVTQVFNELLKLLGDHYSSDAHSETQAKSDLSAKGIFNKFASVVTGIFQPIIPAIAASGMIKHYYCWLFQLV